MSMSALLEVIIGLLVLFWFAASLCSFIVEVAWSTARNLRAKALQRFVCEMILGTDRLRMSGRSFLRSRAGQLDASSLADPLAVLSHGLISALRKPAWFFSCRSTPPSYVPSHQFATVLLERVAELRPALNLASFVRTELQKLGESVPEDLQKKLNEKPDALHALCTWAVSDVASDRLACVAEELRKVKPTSIVVKALDQVAGVLKKEASDSAPAPDAGTLWVLIARELSREQRTTFQSSYGVFCDACEVVRGGMLPAALHEALRPLAATAVNADALRDAIAKWYDDVMDRASGWYKRHVTAMLAVSGLVLAALFNINPISLAGDLAADPALRKAVVSLGEQIVEGGERSSLAQQALFVRAAERRRWRERVQAGANASADASATLRAVTFEMAPLLVTEPGYVGLALTALVGDLPGDASNKPEFLATLCMAHLEATRAGYTSAVVSQLRQRGVDAAALSACNGVLAPFMLHGGTSKGVDLYDVLWNHRMLIWAPELGRLVREVHREPSGLKDPAGMAAQLVTVIDETLYRAKRTDAAVHGLWSRLPSLGNHAAAFSSCKAAVLSILGWVLMAVAVSLGAPFWYELLSKVTNRRGTGPRPDTSHGDA